MITGTVNALTEAILLFRLQDGLGGVVLVETLLDTGYNGDLSLPSSTIASLQLPFLTQNRGVLADGTVQTLNVYSALLEWEGQFKRIEVDEIDGRPLLGVGRRDALAVPVSNDAGDTVRRGNAVAGLDRRHRLALDGHHRVHGRPPDRTRAALPDRPVGDHRRRTDVISRNLCCRRATGPT